jgi:hypothetical protein
VARVFVSYRRADGAYGVGWLAERLRSLDSITGVETAFHDAALRAGDDFPDALDTEIAGSDLVIAVIGPEWAGAGGAGSARRIEDPDDWVVREIATAFEQDTAVIPILMDGAEHPLASEVHPSIAAIARLHALPFADGRDLDTIVEHIESHLSDLDRDRARLAGLEEPVEVPQLTHLPALIAGAVVAAAIGAWLGAISAGLLSPWPLDDVGSVAFTRTRVYDWLCVSLVALGAAAGAFAVFGVAMLLRLTGYVRLDWVRLALTGCAIFGIALVMALSSQGGDLIRAGEEPIPDLGARIALNGALALIGLAAWAGCLLAPLLSVPRADDEQIGRRVQTLALMRDAERWGAISVAAVLTLLSMNGLALVGAAYHARDLASFEPIPNLGFAAMTSLLLILAHTVAITRLRDQQEALDRSLAELPPRYRANALPRLVATTFDDGGWGFRILLALPVAAAIVATIAIGASAS